MNKNPILEELHAVRRQLLADAGGTLDALVDRLQREEQASDRPRFKCRTNRCAAPAASGKLAVDNQTSQGDDP
jgi:hypothetical protein